MDNDKKYTLSDKSLNILDGIRVQALTNILKRKTDLQPHQVEVLEKNKRHTEKTITSRKKKIEQKNTPFADLLKDFKVEGK